MAAAPARAGREGGGGLGRAPQPGSSSPKGCYVPLASRSPRGTARRHPPAAPPSPPLDSLRGALRYRLLRAPRLKAPSNSHDSGAVRSLHRAEARDPVGASGNPLRACPGSALTPTAAAGEAMRPGALRSSRGKEGGCSGRGEKSLSSLRPVRRRCPHSAPVRSPPLPASPRPPRHRRGVRTDLGGQQRVSRGRGCCRSLPSLRLLFPSQRRVR